MIRRARVKDAPTVHGLLLAARDDIPLPANFADQLHQNWVREECRQQHVWLDERDGSLAGVMVMSVTEIFYLVTASEFRGRGVASGLIDHAISNVRRRYRVGVTAKAREENTAIVRLLLKKGFYRHPFLQSAFPGWTVFAFGNVR
jgi:ribosomal protein S18 acetylase RimI-like enzyme